MSDVALITGITGQDGSYLAEFLLRKGYEVHGIHRGRSMNTGGIERIDHLLDQITLHRADLMNQSSLINVLNSVEPTEVYNLAAQSSVGSSWTQPIPTVEVTGTGALRLLDAVRTVDKSIKFYQASSSEMFGKASETPQRETTPFQPRNLYGAAKVLAHWATVNHRESYGMYCCSGILYNHESPRRGRNFVTRKITRAVARISLGLEDTLRLGNLMARRDWGFAGDYVRAMWLMLQQDQPDDYVVGTGELHSVEEFVETAFAQVSLNWRDHVVVDPQLFRPAEVDLLLADPSKARAQLGWEPKLSFEQLIRTMVDADIRRLKQQGKTARGMERPRPKLGLRRAAKTRSSGQDTSGFW